MSVNLIYSATENRVIGNRGRLVAMIPEDLKQFKELTTGGVVIMGSATYNSLPAKRRPLKDRTNIVLSRDPRYKVHGCKVYHDLHDAIKDHGDQAIWVIGGGDVFKQAIDVADKIYLTTVYADLPGDTYAPEIDPDRWHPVYMSEKLTHADLTYRYTHYEKKHD